MTPLDFDSLGPLPQFLSLPDAEGVVPIVTPAGGKAWLVCEYALARQVLTDTRFSRQAAVRSTDSQVVDAQPVRDSMVSMDGAEHTRLRRIVTSAFSTGRVNALTPAVEMLTARQLAELAAAGPGADLISGLATPLPLAVLCSLLGVPPQDTALFRDWVEVLFDISASTADEKSRRRLELTSYMADLIGHKRRWPKEDLLTDMITAHDEGRMSMAELLTMGLTLLMAGYETTVGQIGLSVHALLADRTSYDQLREGIDRVVPMTEELLRLTPSTPLAFPRVATETTTLADVTIQRGEVVIVSLLHGNRDDRAYPEAELLALDGRRAPHLTFGHGVHRCVGAPLARLQVNVVLTRLVERFPTLRLADRPDAVVWKDGLSTRGLARLLVTW